MSLNFVLWGPVYNKSLLVQITAWQAIFWTNVRILQRRMNVSLGLNDLILRVFWRIETLFTYYISRTYLAVITTAETCYRLIIRCDSSGWKHLVATVQQDKSIFARIHDDVIKWTYFPYYWLLWGESMISLICAWTKGWTNNRDAGDLRRHRSHYEVTVMLLK